jgi:hypothetical protein
MHTDVDADRFPEGRRSEHYQVREPVNLKPCQRFVVKWPRSEVLNTCVWNRRWWFM